MRRNEVINALAEKYDYKSYLEIGVDNPNNCFNLIKVEHKIGVDPVKGGTHKMTSDEFFKSNEDKFDLGFIDGLHEAPQVEKDIINLLEILNPNGTIVVHDVHPKTEEEQKVPRIQKVWTGNVWKAWAKLRRKKNLYMFTIDSDHGLGIIRAGSQTAYYGPYSTYKNFVDNKDKILNIKGPECL